MASTDDLSTPSQRELCKRFGVSPVPAPADLKAGVAKSIRENKQPLNGLRHPPEGDTTGWYIWAGEELSDDPDLFEPVHVGHLAELCPQVMPYLALPPGWRFLITSDYEDVWEDPALLEV